ncbi:hypothetical protein IMPR6_380056 [Imperialibacter sp. EC-SDR9]|nr:conserved hypothetical protein [Imperialibacter sp. 75]CAD5266304.1 conserved hypothetical protein [Imperialibacter sp. 89]VVT23823.1 hypothetical protein IMPR6_380056 [Imperialibacter sp. EC-SDR9]
MTAWLKYLWNESGKASFLFKFLFPAIALVFAWRFLGLLYITNIGLSDFETTSGEIYSVKITEEQPFGRNPRIEHNLKIQLANGFNTFRLRDHFEPRFGDLVTKLPMNTKVTLYHPSKTQAYLYMLRQFDLYQIEAGGQIIFDFGVMIRYQKDQMGSYALLSLVCWFFFGLYLFEQRHRRLADGKSR